MHEARTKQIKYAIYRFDNAINLFSSVGIQRCIPITREVTSLDHLCIPNDVPNFTSRRKLGKRRNKIR